MKRRNLRYRPDQDYYTQLGIAHTATPEEIQQAYRQQAKLLHPDMNPERREWATEQFQLLNEAYEVLSDPGERQEYNNLRWAFSSRAYGDQAWGDKAANGQPRRKYEPPPPVYTVREKPGQWLETIGLGIIRPFYAAVVDLLRSPYRYVLVLLALVLLANLVFILATLVQQ